MRKLWTICIVGYQLLGVTVALRADPNASAVARLPSAKQRSATCGTMQKNSTKVSGGKIGLSLMSPYPPELADEFCCSMARPSPEDPFDGNYYTMVDMGPSGEYPDERNYICTVYYPDPSAPKPRFIPGNDTTRAGFAPTPANKDPQCPSHKTLEDCNGPDPAQYTPCAWWGRACHYDPPIECASMYTLSSQPLCINVILAETPFANRSAPRGRQLRPFNWTAGTISENATVAVMPTQVLQEGRSTWWSMAPTTPSWEVCVQYNELFANGSASDPNSGFEACVSKSLIGFDATRGTTHSIDAWAGFGEGLKGFSANESFWVQFAFWSNATK